MPTILEKLFKKKKKITLEEVRIEEKRLEIRENQLVKKLESTERRKNDLFRKGAETKTRALRRIYARKFEEATKQGQMEERELLRLGKELRVLSRLRMLLERRSRTSRTASLLERLDDSQLRELARLVDSQDLPDAEFDEKVDMVLGLTEQEPEEVTEGLGEEALEVMKVWEEMDRGQFEFEEGLRTASRAVEEKEAQKEKGQAEAG